MDCCCKTYTIKEIGAMFDVASSTLRYYEDIGLLEHVGRSPANQRIYTDEHINRLNAIACFKRTGLSVNNMVKFFEYEKNLPEHIDEIIEMVTSHEEEINNQLKKMTEDLKHIQKKVRYYNAIKESYEKGTPFPCFDTI